MVTWRDLPRELRYNNRYVLEVDDDYGGYKLEVGIRDTGCKLCQIWLELLREDESIRKGVVSTVVVGSWGVR